MRKTCLFLIIFISSSVYAQQWTTNSDAIKSNLNINSSIEIIPQSDDYEIKYVIANLTLNPLESFGQKAYNKIIKPEAQIENNIVKFRWDNPKDLKLYFYVAADVIVKNSFIKVKDKIKFPIKTDLSKYILPSENIDSDNKKIAEIASQLASGEDDLYVIVFKIANWVESNINYSLDTLTADVSQKSSWVLENKYGVCDELSSLFIAMVRSLGIPARYVTGLAYTSWNNINDFGNHAWAEVYFQNYGWVPVDIAYGQIGWIDPTHIKLKESLDSNEPAIYYEWLGKDIDIISEKVNLDVNVMEKSGDIKENIILDLKPLKPNAGFGSYNILELFIKNLDDFYKVITIYVSKSKELEIEDKRQILLKPNQEKKVFFIVKIDENLNKDYSYQFPIEMATSMNTTIAAHIESNAQDRVYTKDEMYDLLSRLEETEEKTYSTDIEFECRAEDSVKQNNYFHVNCTARNAGNHRLDNLNVCYKDDCRKIDLAISQSELILFSYPAANPGINDIAVSIKNPEISRLSLLNVNVLDEPKIKISDMRYPSDVSYEDRYNLTFHIKKASFAKPKNIVIIAQQNKFQDSWDIGEIDRDVVLSLYGENLNEGNNEVKLIITYEDELGNRFESQEKIDITLNKLKLNQKIKNIIRKLFRWL